jgi:Tol biopolymer transport system component/tRNA A-37 threonylcarbamoyl transferase component Bud32
LIGRTIAQYRIIEKLGEGGMGVVYKAEHARLHKQVALKFLRPEILESHTHRARFVREARAAASLDHSAICPVYDFAEVDGQTFMAMAYIEGRDLKQRIAAGPLPFGEVVLLAVEVAEGLEAAHRQGIVHRDIKPSNIMITGAGHAKITDFGLVRAEEATKITRSGVAVGTIAYMAPEQTSGGETDQRTDIWGLGVVIYEMITGRRPFSGTHDLAIAHAIRSEEPLPVHSLRPETPPELLWILKKALAKDPKDRYQSATDMLRDLRALRTKLASDKPRDKASWAIANRRVLWLLCMAVLLLAGGAIMNYLGCQPEVVPPAGSAFGHPVQVTNDEAWEGDPCLSPDGTRIAFVKRIAGNDDIHVIGIQGGRSIRLTDDPAADRDPAWFPDGSALVFTSERGGQPAIWKVDQMGGNETLVLAAAADPAISPDGRWLAFSRVDSSGQGRIFIAPWDRPAQARQLTLPANGSGIHRHPAWSPGQTELCYATLHDLWLVSVTGDPDARSLSSGGLADDYPVWSADGSWIYFSSNRENTLALWRVKAAGGRSERLTYGSGPESHPSLAADESRLAYTTSTESLDSDVWLLDRRNGRDSPLTTGGTEDYQACLAPDGSFAIFVSVRMEGKSDLWLQRLVDGRPAGEPVRLTDQVGQVAHPAVSADGGRVAYYSFSGDNRDIWFISVSDRRPVRVTHDEANDIHPAWSPDGGGLVFSSNRGGVYEIWVVAVADDGPTSEPRRISPAGLPGMFPVWSPDGRNIAFVGHRGGRNYAYVVPADGNGPPEELPGVLDPKRLRWLHEDDAAWGSLWIAADWGDGLISIRAVTDPAQPPRSLIPPVVFGPTQDLGLFDTSADGHLVVYASTKQKGDIWVLAREK